MIHVKLYVPSSITVGSNVILLDLYEGLTKSARLIPKMLISHVMINFELYVPSLITGGANDILLDFYKGVIKSA